MAKVGGSTSTAQRFASQRGSTLELRPAQAEEDLELRQTGRSGAEGKE